MKKFKDIVKKNPEPAKSANVDAGQLGQYSAKSQVSEDGSLSTYLSSRGINPKFVSRDTKISHAKSNEFKTWKKNHMFEDNLNESAMLDKYLMSRGINPSTLPTNQKVAYAKSQQFIVWKQHHVNEDITKDKSDGDTRSKQAHSPTAVRQGELDKAAKFNIVKPVHTQTPIKKEGSQTGHLTPESVQMSESPKEGGKKKFSGMFNPAPKGTFAYDQAIRKKKHDDIEKQQSKSGEGMTSAIDRLQKHLNKEGSEMTDLQKKAAKYDFTKTKSGLEVPKQKKPFRMGNEPIVKNEDVMDPQAAIAKVPDTDPSISERTRQLSKSARMIKALYKSKRMVKEDLVDHEKEDKSVATYGKKPKFDKADEKDSAGENKPNAAAVMTGGTTLTGEKRDDVEIDPMMRLRPGQPDPFKKKDDKKDDKKDSNKAEKK